MLDKEIIERGIKYIQTGDIMYFDVQDIKDKATDLLVRGTKVKHINDALFILAKEIRKKTEFDYMMERTLNFINNQDKYQ